MLRLALLPVVSAFNDKSSLQAAVNDCLTENTAGDCPTSQATYGTMNTWDTSKITSLSGIFFFKQQFNQDVSTWDTSRVTDMSGVFSFAGAFNSDVSNWDTSKVANMKHVFLSATVFNQDVSGWDTSAVTNFERMFASAKAFNQDISSWDVSKAAELQFMFNNAEEFNQDLSCWNTVSPYDSVINHDTMFTGSAIPHYPCWYDRWWMTGPNNPHTCDPCTDIPACANTTCVEAGTTCPVDGCACTPHFKDNGANRKDGLNATLTQCTCSENQHVVSSECVDCPPGTTRPAGDEISDPDTTCQPVLCDQDFHVQNHKCEPCAGAPAGQDASGPDQPCTSPTSPCDLCEGTCTDNICVCDEGTAGENCNLDITASGRQVFIDSLRKSLPTESDIRHMHLQLKQFILDSGTDTQFDLQYRDLLPHQKAIVAKTGKEAELKACLDCIVDINNKVSFVHTDTWSILRDKEYITKQTKISDTEYDMECWRDGWYNKTRFNINQREKLYECNGYVVLIGSQAVVCTPDMCECEADDLTYTCKEDTQASSCYDLDCSDFGGHKQTQCTNCTHSECCTFASRKDFNEHCESLSPRDFVQQQCCLRDTC